MIIYEAKDSHLNDIIRPSPNTIKNEKAIMAASDYNMITPKDGKWGP